MIRTFIAIELDAPLRGALAEFQTRLRSRVMKELNPDARLQWVRLESIHLTLKFLGDIEESQVSEVHAALALAVASRARFALAVGGVGVFPDLRQPRVLWVGLGEGEGERAGKEPLIQLAGSIDEVLEVIGFPRERRPFSPHLTLARIKEGARGIGRALTASGVMTEPAQLGRLPVQAVSLMKSELRPSGAVYTRLGDAPLRGSGEGE